MCVLPWQDELCVCVFEAASLAELRYLVRKTITYQTPFKKSVNSRKKPVYQQKYKAEEDRQVSELFTKSSSSMRLRLNIDQQLFKYLTFKFQYNL